MGSILYEISFSHFIANCKLYFFIALIVLLAMLYCIRQFTKDNTFKETKNKILIVGQGLMICIMVLSIHGQYKEYVFLKEAYEKGKCIYIEGVIHNYKGDSEMARWREGFMVDNVLFSYSSAEGTQGYNTPKSEGGVISGNGQSVKIGYVPVNIALMVQNKIVYIEQLE